MFPIRDENPLVRTPVTTITIIVLNVIVWAFVQGMGDPAALLRSLCTLALIPGDWLGLVREDTIISFGDGVQCRLSENAGMLTPLTSMFMHGGWFHIIANMWFLWVFGDNVEDAMGVTRFLVFYIVCGLVAAGAQIITAPTSVVPMVGASGAIGGIMGAYARLYPHARIHMLVLLGFYFTTLSVPAFAMLGYWFFIQLLGGIPALGGNVGGVAFWAHIGGFIAGLVLVGPLHRPDYLAAHRAMYGRKTARHRLF